MTGNSIHFRSDRDDWPTPQSLFDGLDQEFGFELDVCATEENAKCRWFFSPADDGLVQAWAPAVCFCNPPYGREIGRWLAKGFNESLLGATVVCLVPSRTDTKWWHRYARRGEIRYMKGRIRFEGAEHSAPFPSAVVIFRPPRLGIDVIPMRLE